MHMYSLSERFAQQQGVFPEAKRPRNGATRLCCSFDIRSCHVVPLIIEYPGFNAVGTLSEHWNELEPSALRRLQLVAASLKSERIEVEAKVVRGSPAAEIVAESERIGADLVAIGTLGSASLY